MNEYDGGSSSGASQDASAHYGASYGNNYGGYQSAPPEPPRKDRRGMGAGAVIAICLICSILAAALGVGGTYLVLENDAVAEFLGLEPQATPPQLTTAANQTGVPAAVSSGEESVPAGSRIYELAKRQVVGVTTEISYLNFFGQISASSVEGSGFIISGDGYIMTNYHVIKEAVEGGYEVSVLTYDGTEYTAQVTGYDKDNDVAVLKIDAQGLSPAELGDSDAIAVGQQIFPVGNPLGELNYTMTTGIVSATDRAITTNTDSVPIDMFQIDAAVNSGNSGGPVYNTAGQVVGMVTAKSNATGVEGLGFAIPINDAVHIANQLMEYGYVTDRAAVGIGTYTVPDSVARRYGMVQGALVSTVTAGGPADLAGIREGDIVTAVDGREVLGSTELTTIVRTYAVGDSAEFTVWRAGETMTMTVTFSESPRPEEDASSSSYQEQNQSQYPYGYGDMEDFFRQFFGSFGY